MTFKHRLPNTQKSHKNGHCELLFIIERHKEKTQLEVFSNSNSINN